MPRGAHSCFSFKRSGRRGSYFQQQARLINEVILVERVRCAHFFHVTFIDASHRSIPQIIAEIIAREIGGRHTIVFPMLDCFRNALWIPNPFNRANIAHRVREYLARFLLIEDNEFLGLIAETVAVCLRHFQTERMICDGSNLLGEVGAKKFFEPLHHFPRGFACKRNRKNRMCGYVALFDDVRDAVRDSARFACACWRVD